MSTVDTVVHLVYLACATCFVLGLHLMNAPATARRGNQLSAAGMAAAVATTAFVLAWEQHITVAAVAVLIVGVLGGTVAGLVTARKVKMTAMPQLVSLFNAVGGGAAALVALGEAFEHSSSLGALPLQTTLTIVLDLGIGGVTFSGSLIATGKLAALLPGRPVNAPGGRILLVVLALGFVVPAGLFLAGQSGLVALAVLTVAALGVGVLMTLPIGGADMPVVISLLNACTGTAVAMAGFVLGSSV
ncbi:MAG TPA: NAD(P)(+) transhydrogenase (Re/Si-specific) subunit beta, partial [Actinoplanes sp.]|nr:NAD(P)(+) transhydrogenase (Re/Si-specific) subunit beta [Actinoplanes sp.]